MALQEAAEASLVSLFKNTNLAAIHATDVWLFILVYMDTYLQWLKKLS
jgi:hypothetical protein